MNKIIRILLPVVSAITMMSCEHSVQVHTKVYEDGSLDRTMVLDGDASQVDKNMFGISKASGWELTVAPETKKGKANTSVDSASLNSSAGQSKDSLKKDDEFIFTYQKHFASAEASNAELNSGTDSLFNIEAKFEKKFRWFYTYLTFSETYKAINRFKHVSPADYFTREDYAFIDRLPAEGKQISMADSIFLDQLTSRIYDVYATRGFFEAYFHGFIDQMKEHHASQQWIDSLEHHKEDYFIAVTKDKLGLDEKTFMIDISDSLKIQIPSTLRDLYTKSKVDIKMPQEPVMNFMNHAGEGKYTHTIEMPWEVVSSNGDSLAGNTIIWNPPVTKFLLKDYTFHAESRKLNYWAIIVSLLIVGGTIWLYVRKGEFVWEVRRK